MLTETLHGQYERTVQPPDLLLNRDGFSASRLLPDPQGPAIRPPRVFVFWGHFDRKTDDKESNDTEGLLCLAT